MKKTFLILLLSFSVLSVIGAGLVYAQGGTGGTGSTGGTGGTGSTGGTGGTGSTGGTGGSGTTNVNITLDNPFSIGNSLFALMKAVVDKIILPIGGILAVLAFIYSGFLYVTAQGNESKLATAHKALLYTAIGTAVLLGSWVLANVICQHRRADGGIEK